MFYYNLDTERVLLKNIDKGDRDFIFSQFSDKEVNRYLFDAEPLARVEEADEIVDYYLQPEPRPMHRWIIVRKSDGIKMGTCGFHRWNFNESNVEIGYDLKKEFWGNGYMSEALNAMIDFAKTNMKLKMINAHIYIENQKSIQLVSKLGFIPSGTMNEVFRGKEYLHNIYSLYLPKTSPEVINR